MILWAGAMAPRSDGQAAQKTPAPAAAAAPNEETEFLGNEACAKCHHAIFDAYAGTAMARASGPATQDFMSGEFQHEASGMHYRVYEENGDAWLSFDRTGANELHGKRKLLYFIGSGHRGRTFLFEDDGFVFESPINFYAQKGASSGQGVWDMAPAYENAKEMPLNLAAAASCLACHTSNGQAPMPGTDNKYGAPLFAHAGITCERCHGAGAAHVKQMNATHGADTNGSRMNASHDASREPSHEARGGTNPAKGGATLVGTSGSTGASSGIVNPDKLSPVRRDAVCMQCHLEGNAAIQQPGRRLYQFQPGDDLSDFVHYFVLTGDGKENFRAVSQFEALAQSKCKRASGDAMTCTSCHDPHSSPAPAEKVAFYRGKCLACHGADFGAKHHVEQQDCAQCHMPRVTTADVAHTQASDHRILRVPLMPLQSVGSPFDPSHGPPPEPTLMRFPAGQTPVQTSGPSSGMAPGVASAGAASAGAAPAGESPKGADESVRDLALAWVALAGGNSSYAFAQATHFLERATAQSPEDAAILSALAYNEQRRGLTEKAREHYEHALRVDPLTVDAAANLAVIEANAGHLERAVALWKPAFERAPARSSLGLNLARGLCLSGHADQAQATIARVLEFNPDLAAGRSMLKQLESGEVKCVGH